MEVGRGTSLGLSIALVVTAFVTPVRSQGLVVDGAGNVGIGTTSPAERLHIVAGRPNILVDGTTGGSQGTEMLTLRRSQGNVRIRLERGSGQAWSLTNFDGIFRISDTAVSGQAFELDGSGNLTIGGSLTENSSRALKTDIEPIDDREVLAKLVALPVFKWRYKTDQTKQARVGPMAEDFQEAFGIGDGKRIALGSVSGVSLAAIRGLNQRFEEAKAEMQSVVEAKQRDVEALRQATAGRRSG